MSLEATKAHLTKLAKAAYPCPECGKIPRFNFSVEDQNDKGFTRHIVERKPCCIPARPGRNAVFLTYDFKGPDPKMLKKSGLQLINDWNERAE